MSDTTAPQGTLIGPPDFTTVVVPNPFGLSAMSGAAEPTFVDIDGDGDLDAFVGDNSGGETWFFQNTGTASAPVFAPAAGVGLNAASYYGFPMYGISPSFSDIDADGDLDAFVGNMYGDTLFYANIGSAQIPAFAAPAWNPYGLTGVGLFQYASPTFADIDGDGDPDAFIGNLDGDTWFFENTGSASEPVFGPASANPFGLTSRAGGIADPSFADIDGDGDLDAFIGAGSGYSRYFQNTGSATNPVFAAPIPSPFGLTYPQGFASPDFADIDGDGDLDAFIGTPSGDILFTLNTRYVVAPVTSGTMDGTYGPGSVITLNVDFSEAVIVDTTGGTPSLSLETGGTGGVAIYSGGSGTSTLSFTYTVQSGDAAADLDIQGASALALNGGTIRDAAGNDAILTLAAPGAPGSLAANAALVIDAVEPTATLPTTTIANTGSVAARSTEAGTAYLVSTSVAVTDLASITGAADASWNQVAITAADTDTALAATGLADGTYRLYATDALGNLSAASSGMVTIDTTAPTATLTAAALPRTGTATVQSSETGTAYLVRSNVAVTDVASITGAADASWNHVAITAAGTDTALAMTGLADGTYRLYAADAAGNLSAASDGVVTVDSVAPRGTSVSTPAFAAAVANPFGLANVGIAANPSFADIDGDGDLDAFIGVNSGGTWFFRNTGTATDPVFAAVEPNFLHNVGNGASPGFADIDGDGDLDAYIGDMYGDTWVHLNTGSLHDPSFAPATRNPYGLTRTGFDLYSNPTFADIDGDGDLDAFIGRGLEHIRFFENTGSATHPVFTPASIHPFGLTYVGSNSHPAFADIDGDGDLDAYIGSSFGQSRFFLNIGSATNPVFADPVADPYGLSFPGDFASPNFVDLDGDGDLDAVFGTLSGDIQFMRNTGSGISAPVTSASADGSYGVGRVITLNVSFSENVIVDTSGGTPTLSLATGGSGVATYAGGSGTSSLSFTYTVQPGDDTADLDITGASALALNGATIRDAAGNDAILTLAAAGAPGSLAANAALVIDTVAPTATAGGTAVASTGALPVQSTETGTAYLVSTSVTVTTVASITSAADASWNQAAITAAGTDTALAATGLAEGTYRLYTADAAGNLSAAASSEVVVDNTAPTATLASTLVSNAGSVTVRSSEAGTAYLVHSSVDVTDVASITDSVLTLWNEAPITAAGTDTPLAATGLVEGTYRLYTTDAAGNLSAASATLLTVDNTAPHGTLVGPPAFSAPVADPFGPLGLIGAVNPSLVDIDGDGDLDAFIGTFDGNSGFFLNAGTASHPVFVAAGSNPFGLADAGHDASPSFADIDGDGDLDALIGDLFGNTLVSLNNGTIHNPSFAAPELNPYGLTSIGIQSHPTLADIDGDGDPDAFVSGQFFENTGSATSPSFVQMASPSGLGSLGLNINPEFVDFDHDGDLDAFIGTRLFPNIGSATNPAFGAPINSPYGLSFAGIPSLSIVDIDADGDLDVFIGTYDGEALLFLNSRSVAAPVTSATADGPHGVGRVITLNVAFSENVFVDTNGGTPTLTLETGAIDRVATYAGGSGTGTLTFTYVVQPGDASADLDIANASALTLNGGTIRDAAGNNAVLTLATPGAAGSLAANAALVIETIAPTATLTSATMTTTTGSATVRSSEAGTAYLVRTWVSVTDVASITAADDANWNQVAITAPNADTALAVTGLADGTYKLYTADAAGNVSAASSGTVTIDATAPTTTAVTAASGTQDGTYRAGSFITLSITFSENVIVDTSGGMPTLRLETGLADRFATYSGGSGTNTLTFTYTVQAGDLSADLDFASTSALALNGATIRDAVGHDAILTLAAPGTAGSLAANAALVVNGIDDILTGTPGPDVLDGGLGADTMTGDAGDDRYDVDNPGDVVIELAAGGTDTVYSTLASYTLAANVENGVIATGAAADLTGNWLANTLHAGSGNNVLNGAGGIDQVSYASASSGVTVSLAATGPQATGGSGSDTLLSVEGLTGSAYADHLTGKTGVNNLEGGAGNDTLDGGAGGDSMTGGSGNDTYTVDNSGDKVVELASGGTDTVYSTLGNYTLTANVENGVIATDATAKLTGNALANVLHAGAGDNVLNGAGGIDQVSYASASSGVTVSLAVTGPQATGGSGSDTLISIENLTGSAHADSLTGNAGANSLAGGAGNDTLDGGAGADTMAGGNGNDSYFVDDIGDVVLETQAGLAVGGTDTVHTSLASYTLGANVENGVIATGAAADLTGNALANVLTAGDGDNVLDGGGGNDQVSYASASSGVTVSLATSGPQNTVGSGTDTLISIESLLGSDWADSLTGSAWANRLNGGAGDDTLEGLGGNDNLTGGAGADTFVFGNLSGRDVIQDFSLTDGDLISLLSNINGSGIVDGTSALARMSDVSGNAVIDLDLGYTITLLGWQTTDFNANNFIFY
jgi:Ca2+-binding RTX toxin-like protein